MAHHGNIIGLWGALESDALAVDEQRCVVVRDRHARCRRCAEACPSGCISIESGRLKVQQERCVGCGTCATVCPSGALTALQPSDEALFDSCLEALGHGADTVSVACGAVAAEGDSEVVCLGRVDESLLMRLANAGAARVELAHGPCGECLLSAGFATAEAVAQTACALAAAWGRPFTVSFVERSCDDSRMLAVAGALDNPAPVAAASGASSSRPVAKVRGDGVLPRVVPSRREALLSVLRTWPAPAEKPVPTRLWGTVAIDGQRCVSCRMCAVFCPTDALSRTEVGAETFGLVHRPSLCVRCETCQSVCMAGALRVRDEVSTDELIGDTAHVIALEEPAYQRVGPHSATDAMRNVLGTPRVYER